jgi:lipid A 3-O-deacylase
MRRWSYWYVAFIVLLALGGARRCFAQEGPETDGNEIEIWTAGGHGTNGVAQHTGVLSVGFRYGWVITAPHGPGLLRGRFEYAVDAVPVFLVFQRTDTAYGAAVNPFALIWNLDTQGRVLPYIELGGGVLFTSTQVPEGTSRVNFTTAGAVGAHILTKKVTWSADIRFEHISNAGLKPLNPGINTAQLRLGVSWFTHPHR